MAGPPSLRPETGARWFWTRAVGVRKVHLIRTSNRLTGLSAGSITNRRQVRVRVTRTPSFILLDADGFDSNPSGLSGHMTHYIIINAVTEDSGGLSDRLHGDTRLK